MKVKNTSERDQFVTVRIDGRREVHTVGPSEVFEMPDIQGINICKNSPNFIAADAISQKKIKETIPLPEDVKESRRRGGSTRRATKDIEAGKKNAEIK